MINIISVAFLKNHLLNQLVPNHFLFLDQYKTMEEEINDNFLDVEEFLKVDKKETQSKKLLENLQGQKNVIKEETSMENQNENLLGINASIHVQESSFPTTFSFMGPSKTNEKDMNIKFQLQKSQNEYKVVFVNS